MTLTGMQLTTYAAGTFAKVPEHLDQEPARSFDLAERLGERVCAWLRDDRGLKAGADVLELSSSIPMRVFEARTSLDELCKVKHQCKFMMDHSVEEAFKADPTLRLIQKVGSSMWRWGCGRGGWNETVDAYEGIRSFEIGHPAFEATFDHSTGYNERGYSEHSRTFLDGALAFLVHYKGEHVLTVGFSLMAGRRLLLQQVQAKSRTGNRWMFKLPRNLTEHVLDRLAAAFPNHALFVADGGDLIGETLASYRRGLRAATEDSARARKALERDPKDERGLRRLAESRAERRTFKDKIAHCKADLPRIAAAYAASGRHALGQTLKVNGLRHYAVLSDAGARTAA
ncbi:MAG: hypothetical protein J0I42_09785 [Bosea sp.]|uniref:hypothetical protein n=1 Tax=Bosea sp. (in: a-proteobacteria) TaxID=1871050 RepID=UPI001AD4E85B|nr:hypothetical protein [Bosea sp. (in: a-proteobacteria)]MBN9452229.1 hypothetical protein [Bosea sp. (in: a-proteobacteria)]